MGEGERVAVGDSVPLPVPLRLGEGDGVPLAVGEGDRVPLAVGEGEPEGVGEGVATAIARMLLLARSATIRAPPGAAHRPRGSPKEAAAPAPLAAPAADPPASVVVSPDAATTRRKR